MRRAAQGGVALAVAAGSFGVASLDKAVSLSVDGKSSSMHVFGSTVADALDKKGITIGAHDEVVPSLGTKISDGDTISVRYGRKLTVTVDGVVKEYWTTATTVDAALRDLNIRAGSNAKLSASRSQEIGRRGLALSVTNPKTITLTVSGKAKRYTTHAATVADALAAAKVTADSNDVVSPARTTPLTQGMSVALTKVDVKNTNVTEAVAFGTVTKKDAKLFKGDKKVLTKGKAGSRAVVKQLTLHDGKLKTTKVLKTTVTAQPVAQVVAVGTKARPAAPSRVAASAPRDAGNTSGAGINMANAAMWDRIAQCESGGRWNINTGNGYYGGLQFDIGTWRGAGGGDFASRADLASRAEQITVANRVYADRGLQPWGCRHAA